MSQPPNGVGSQKNSWPEYKGWDVDEVLALLKQDPQNNVFVQWPTSFMPRPRPSDPSVISKDIWLYPDAENKVVIIPRRGGSEHHSPVSGWIELTGMGWQDALSIILEEIIGVNVVYGPEGFIRDRSYNTDRVFLDVNEDGKVAKAPTLG